MQASSARPSRSCSSSRENRIVTTTPEACKGCATVSGSSDSTRSWSTRPPQIRKKPASQAGAPNRVRASRGR
jgi:hypothetical protein